MEIGNIVTGVISALVAIILVLGAMLKFYLPKMKKNQNPGTDAKLDTIIAQLGRMDQRLNDIWDKVKE